MSVPSRIAVCAVVIGAIAWLAMARPSCACSPGWKAYVFQTRSDLRDLVNAEEAKWSRDSSYTARLDSLPDADRRYNYHPLRGESALTPFRPAAGVHIRITWADRRGFLAVATNDGTTGTCAIFIGTIPDVPRIAGAPLTEGQPRCEMRVK